MFIVDCSNGSYGLNCSIPCHCQRCHPIAGVCEGSCDQGWTKHTAGICNIKGEGIPDHLSKL